MLGINSSRVSLAISATALFIALGGTALAVTQIGTSQIRDGAVTNSKLAHNAVGNGKLTDNAVASSKVKDGSLTASDVAPGTFVQGLGFAPAARHVVPIGGGGITIFATGFGTFSGACSNTHVPTVSYTPDGTGENFEATVTSDGGSPVIDTQNAIGSGVAHPINNSVGGRQSISFQVGLSDPLDHLATGTITSQFLFGTGCLFMAQGLTTS